MSSDKDKKYLKEYLNSLKEYLDYYGFELVFKLQIKINDKYKHLKNDKYAIKYRWTILDAHDKEGFRISGDNLEELKKEFEDFVETHLLD